MLQGVLAYLIWGLFPAFFPLLKPATAVEIIAHRILWTAVVMTIVVVATRRWRELLHIDLRTWGKVALASVLISTNWLLYVYVVNASHVADAALGYFMNPLVNVALGVLFLREQLRPMQKGAVGLAAVAVGLLVVLSGHPPWAALGLAFSFGLYGLVKKGVHLHATTALTAETLIITPIALGYLWWLGGGTFFSEGAGHAALLMSSGLVTALPLLLFGLATKLIPLSTIGMLQYITPTMQMLWAVFVMNEYLEPVRWVGFVIIWTSVVLYVVDLWRARRSTGTRKRVLRRPPKPQ